MFEFIKDKILFDPDIYIDVVSQIVLLMSLTLPFVGLIWLGGRLRSRKVAGGGAEATPAFFSAAIAVALLGGVVGYAGGVSREPAVGTLIPAVLTALAGVVAYLFGIRKTGSRAASSFLLVFVFSLFATYAFGAKLRENVEIASAKRAECSKVFADASVLRSEVAYQRALAIHGKRCSGYLPPQAP